MCSSNRAVTVREFSCRHDSPGSGHIRRSRWMLRSLPASLFRTCSRSPDADGQFVEDIFFQKSCEQIMEAGELDAADRVPYRSPTKGIRVDGYGGDPAEAVGILNLIVLDSTLRRKSGVSPERKWTPPSDAVQLSAAGARRTLAQCIGRDQSGIRAGRPHRTAVRSITRIRFLLVSNRELSERVDGRPAADIEGRQVTYSVWDIVAYIARQPSVTAAKTLRFDLGRGLRRGASILPRSNLRPTTCHTWPSYPGRSSPQFTIVGGRVFSNRTCEYSFRRAARSTAA